MNTLYISVYIPVCIVSESALCFDAVHLVSSFGSML